MCLFYSEYCVAWITIKAEDQFQPPGLAFDGAPVYQSKPGCIASHVLYLKSGKVPESRPGDTYLSVVPRKLVLECNNQAEVLVHSGGSISISADAANLHLAPKTVCFSADMLHPDEHITNSLLRMCWRAWARHEGTGDGVRGGTRSS